MSEGETLPSPLCSLIFDYTTNCHWSPVYALKDHLVWWSNFLSWYVYNLLDLLYPFFFLFESSWLICLQIFFSCFFWQWLVTCLVISLFPSFPLTFFLFSSLGLPYVFSFTAHYSFLPGNPSPYFSCFFLLVFSSAGN